jgi:hypothetical protein
MAYGGLKGVVRSTNRATQGGINVMNRYYEPSFGQAYKAADRFGQIGQMRGEEDEYRDRIRGNLERFGMAGSGSAMALERTAARQFGADRFGRTMDANRERFGAFRSLAGQSLQGGLQSLSQRNQAAYQLAQAKQTQQTQDAARRDQQQAMVGQVVGDVIGTGMDVGMAVATGGLTAPNAIKNFATRAKGYAQGGSTAASPQGGGVGPNPTTLGHYNEFGEWVSDEELGKTPNGYYDENGRWVSGF